MQNRAVENKELMTRQITKSSVRTELFAFISLFHEGIAVCSTIKRTLSAAMRALANTLFHLFEVASKHPKKSSRFTRQNCRIGRIG
jgi:hypothetical protein